MTHHRVTRTLAAAALAASAALAWSAPTAEALPPPGPAWIAYVAAGGGPSGRVVPVNTGTNTNDPVIDVFPANVLPNSSVAISPDATMAYVATPTGNVIPIVTATNTPLAPIAVGGTVREIAILPQGGIAYVTRLNAGTGELVPINLTTNTAGIPIPIPGSTDIAGLAITRAGDAAMVLVDLGGVTQEVVQVNFASGSIGPTITLPPVTGLSDIVIEPIAGTIAYATAVAGGAGVVIPISRTTLTAGTPIAIPASTGLGDIAITPNGTTAYVADTTTNQVVPIFLPTSTPGTAIPIPGSTGLGDIAVTPDGATVYVASADGGSGMVVPVPTGTNVAGAAISTGVPGGASGIAIMPDQAPVAALTATATNPTTFSAAASTVRFGTITSYQWSFGDGGTATTTTPTTTHSYLAPGTYTVQVRLTSSGGTSTSRLFTGQTLYRNGSAQASALVTIVVPAESPAGAAFRQTVTGPRNAVGLLVAGLAATGFGIALARLGRRRRRHARR